MKLEPQPILDNTCSKTEHVHYHTFKSKIVSQFLNSSELTNYSRLFWA